MNIRISIFLCLFYFCVNCSAVSPKWFTIDVDAIQKLTTRLDLLEQKLTRKHHHLHDVMDVSLSNKKSNKVNERWIRDIENRIKTLENTILQNNCDKKIQYLEETVQELSKQVKQQVLYNGRTEKLEAIVKDQENTISKLRDDVILVKKTGTMLRDILVPSEDEIDKDGNTENDAHNQLKIAQRIRSTAVSFDQRETVSNKSKNICIYLFSLILILTNYLTSTIPQTACQFA